VEIEIVAMVKQIKNSYCCVGLMSGTSLDGLDIVLCRFDNVGDKWTYSILKNQTVAYSKDWKAQLKSAYHLTGIDLLKLHRAYGFWLGKQVQDFLSTNEAKPDIIASHGHTVFHEPDQQFNFQLGDGNALAAQSGLLTIADFRSYDICMKGQGAPLVPIGDQLLFAEYDACVNLGGFANISCDRDGKRIAWDICAVNYVINSLVSALNLEMDEDGKIGQSGYLINDLLEELNQISYYEQKAPKTLGQEWVEKEVFVLFDKYKQEAQENILFTWYEHISSVLANELNNLAVKGKVLFTGGGVYNSYLMQLIRAKTTLEIVIPDARLVNYKEALIFAFLGVLKMRGENNCLRSVTGADSDNCSGVLFGI